MYVRLIFKIPLQEFFPEAFYVPESLSLGSKRPQIYVKITQSMKKLNELKKMFIFRELY